LFTKILEEQKDNIKLKELSIHDSQLNAGDFELLAQIVRTLPRLQRLHLDNVTIDKNEKECFQHLSEGISKSKRFRDLIIKMEVADKPQLFSVMNSLLQKNK
jgi:hypothetical protein